VLGALRRPLDVDAKRMPGRAIGVAWFAIDKAAHTLGVSMDLPDRIRPETTLRVPIKLAGLTPGDEARVVVSAVDVGISTSPTTRRRARGLFPRPAQAVGRGPRPVRPTDRRHAGHQGQIRTGGDSGAGEPARQPADATPLALYSGIVTVGPTAPPRRASTSRRLPAPSA
jgi:hypothetical protein